MSGLPQGWTTATVGDLVDRIEAGLNVKCIERPPEAGERGLVKISAVTTGRFVETQSKTLPEGVEPNPRNRIAAGDLLLSRANTIDLVGACAVVERVDRELYLSDKVLRLVASEPAKRWLNLALKTPDARQAIAEASSGNQLSMRNLSQDRLLGLPIPLAPSAEQQRIADKLEAILARVDACRDRLDHVGPLLQRFRQSVLASATSGNLTADFRGESQPVERGPIPIGWRRVTFGDVCAEITVGFVGKMADQYRPDGIPFLRSMNVRAFRFEPKGLLYVAEAFHRQVQKSTLRPGDLAIVRTGAPGTCCVVPANLGEANCSDLVIARPGPNLVPGYGCIVMNSSVASEFVQANKVGVAQAHFNVGSMKIAPLPLPPREEQLEIVRRVERLFAMADVLEARCRQARAGVERLVPAALSKAFRGELVPQNPNDEPATEMLARLATSTPPKKTAKRGRSTA